MNDRTRKALDRLIERDPHTRFRYDASLGVIRHLRGNIAKASPSSRGFRSAVLRFVRDNRDLFGDVGESRMTTLHEATDQGGITLTIQQHHGRYPVYGGSLRAHASRDGTLDTISNRLFPDLKGVPKRPRISADAAVRATLRATKCKQPPAGEPALQVYRHEGKPYLAWRVELTATEPHGREAEQWVSWVDAASGRVLVTFNNLQSVGAVVGNGTGYYSGAGSVNAWDTGTTFQLRDTTRSAGGGPEIITNDEDGSSPSEDADNDWSDLSTTPRHANQGAEVDAHRYAGQVLDYFQTVHGRNSYDGAGGDADILVHYGTNLSNGYWNGTRVLLGDGTGDAATGDDYECSDDWLAHEFTHAYTQYTCGLQYLNESGALNEAISDIFAAFITGDWLIFEDTWLKASAPAWRNMMDPTNGGNWNAADPIGSVLAGHQPSHYSARYTGAADNGGVHINSGIINNLFYLLTVGGTHTVSGIVVTGIGQSAAETLLWRCMTVNLVGNPTATFLDFREAMLDASLDLFPTDLAALTQVKNAFSAVGVGPDVFVRDNLLDTGEEPYPGGYLWASPDIINRTAPAADPAGDFADLTDDGLWENVEFGQDNYVYVRVHNRGPQTGDATVNVYFISATTFGAPGSWIHIGALNEAGIAAGAVRIAGPLTFPSALIPAPGHYCMIAVVGDALDPAPDHNLITSVSDYLHFVRNTNNIAYRNMDVVDAIAGTPGTIEVGVKGLRGVKERFDLGIDLAHFVPGARVRVRGPANALVGAIPRGLKLVRRTRRENFYALLVGDQLLKHQGFGRLEAARQREPYGFDNLLIDKEFQLAVDFTLPKDMRAPRAGRAGPHLVVRQYWRGEAVGAVGIKLRKPARPKPRTRKVARRKNVGARKR